MAVSFVNEGSIVSRGNHRHKVVLGECDPMNRKKKTLMMIGSWMSSYHVTSMTITLYDLLFKIKTKVCYQVSVDFIL